MWPGNSYIFIPTESLIKVVIICYQNSFLVFGSLKFLTDNQLRSAQTLCEVSSTQGCDVASVISGRVGDIWGGGMKQTPEGCEQR